MNHLSRCRFNVNHRSAGFSLVELMVGLTIGLALTLVITLIFINNKTVAKVQDGMNRLEEKAKFISNRLESDIQSAGARGCNGSNVPLTTTVNGYIPPDSNLIPQLVYGAYAGNWARYILGSEGFGTPEDEWYAWSPAFDRVVAGRGIRPGTDVLEIRRPVKVIDGLVSAMPTGSHAIQVRPNSGIQGGSIIIISDCKAAVATQVTTSTTSNDSSGNLGHEIGANFYPGNSTADLGHAFDKDAEVYVMVATTYYVSRSARRPEMFALWSYSFPDYTGAGEAVELVTGVENMDVTYGVNDGDDRYATEYQGANMVAYWETVVSARVSLLMASEEDNLAMSPQPYTFEGVTVTPNDRRLRRVVDVSGSIRNRTL